MSGLSALTLIEGLWVLALVMAVPLKKSSSCFRYKNGLFRQNTFYVDQNLVLGDSSTAVEFHPLDLTRLSLEFYGGKVLGSLEPGLSHVVVHSTDLGRLGQLKALRRERREKFYIVSELWVEECLQQVDLLNERNYQPDKS